MGAHPQHLVLLIHISDVVLQEEAVHLTVHILNGYLEPIKCPRLWNLHLCAGTSILSRGCEYGGEYRSMLKIKRSQSDTSVRDWHLT